MSDRLDLDYFGHVEGPINICVTGPNAEHFKQWLPSYLEYRGLDKEINYVGDQDDWLYRVRTERITDECWWFSIVSDSVLWHRGYWYDIYRRRWEEPLRYWNDIATLREYEGEELGLSECENDQERDELYNTCKPV